MKITSDFPGGNILVDSVEGDTVRLHQDLRDTEGDWFYWYFRVAEADGRTIRFEFTKSVAIGARGPAFSTDGGAHWQWLEAGDRTVFSYSFSAAPVDFCMAIPYTESNWNAFLSGWSNHPHIRTGTLCQSRAGRSVEMLTCGCVNGSAAHRVLITSRHHCCETLASFAVEGLVATIAEDAWACRNVEFVVLPFMDKDGVEEGDQGKNRKPRDHNRDYDGESIYPETAALRRLSADWKRGPEVALDLHCPWLRGGLNELVYFVGQPNPAHWHEQQHFSDILERVKTGPLPFRSSDNLPFGKDWNVASSYDKGTACARWASSLPGIRLVSTIELPYANAGGVEVNATSARAFGADVARAISEYLKVG